MNAIQDKIFDRIRTQGRGKVFIPKDFLDLGSRAAGRIWALAALARRVVVPDSGPKAAASLSRTRKDSTTCSLRS
jgi:hypothetical protein